MSVFQASNISFSYGENSPVLQDLSLELAEGDIALINGASGCGKSTFLNLIYGKLRASELGEMLLASQPLAGFSQAKRFSEIGYVTQYANLQLCSDTCENEIRFGLENLGLAENDIRSRVDAMLRFASLEEKSNTPVQSLSGGQKQTLVIAAVLAMRPRLVLLDEPLAELDVASIDTVVSLIKRAAEEFACSFIICEHKSQFIEGAAAKTFTLKNGALGAYQSTPEPYISLPPREPIAETAIEVRDLTVKSSDFTILDTLSVTFQRAERVAIMGCNGSGKSTLVQSLLGLTTHSGTIAVSGNCGLVFQNPDLMLIRSSVEREILHLKTRQRLGLEQYKLQHPQTLSRGQRLRAAVGSVLQDQSDILILDEPTSGQDAGHINGILKAIEDVETVLICTHDVDVALATAARVIVLDRGKIVGDLRGDQLTREALLRELRLHRE